MTTMKREFLQNLKVGDQPLSTEVIDAIMAENGRDIEAAKKSFADYDTIKTQLDEAQKTIKGFQDQDIDGVRRAASDWEQKYNQAIADHKEQMEAMAFEAALKDPITAAGGRSVAAIKGKLGDQIAALRTSKNQTQDIASAIEGLKKNSAYLFGADKTPPNFSPNTGSPLGSQGSGTFNFGFQGVHSSDIQKKIIPQFAKKQPLSGRQRLFTVQGLKMVLSADLHMNLNAQNFS